MRTLSALLIGLSCAAVIALGQQVSVGVIGGTNFTDDVQAGRQVFPPDVTAGQLRTVTRVVESSQRRPIIGVQFEYRLNSRWAIEADVLRREWKSNGRTIFDPPIEFPDGRQVAMFTEGRVLTPWQFPVLAKYRMPMGRLQPFVAAGPSFRPAGTGTNLSHAGFTAGGGLEFRSGSLRIAPTLRYTRWLAARPAALGVPLQNQVELLVGIDRPTEAGGLRAFGQKLTFGLVAGVGLGQDFRTSVISPTQRSESNGAMVGLMIETALPKDWAIEVNGLYRPLHGSDLEFNRRVRFAHLTWEFPVLVKHRFGGNRRLRPFVAAGPSFRAEGNLNLQSVSHLGGTVGAGIETRFGWLRVAPTVRYTRWSGGDGPSVRAQTWANQTHLLVTFSY